MSVAHIELRTEAVPLIPQAHGMAAASLVERRFRPMGNGIPIRKASGATRAMLSATLIIGCMPSVRPSRRRSRVSSISAAMATVAGTARFHRSPKCSETPLPIPANARNEARTTATA